jgi:hypothetical protein
VKLVTVVVSSILFICSGVFADSIEKCRVDVSLTEGGKPYHGSTTLDVEIKRKNEKDFRPRSANIRDYQLRSQDFKYSNSTPSQEFMVVLRFKHPEVYEGMEPDTKHPYLEVSLIKEIGKPGQSIKVESTAVSSRTWVGNFHLEARQNVGSSEIEATVVCAEDN